LEISWAGKGLNGNQVGVLDSPEWFSGPGPFCWCDVTSLLDTYSTTYREVGLKQENPMVIKYKNTCIMYYCTCP